MTKRKGLGRQAGGEDLVRMRSDHKLKGFRSCREGDSIEAAGKVYVYWIPRRRLERAERQGARPYAW